MKFNKYSRVWYHWKGKGLTRSFLPHVELAIGDITMATAVNGGMLSGPFLTQKLPVIWLYNGIAHKNKYIQGIFFDHHSLESGGILGVSDSYFMHAS